MGAFLTIEWVRSLPDSGYKILTPALDDILPEGKRTGYSCSLQLSP